MSLRPSQSRRMRSATLKRSLSFHRPDQSRSSRPSPLLPYQVLLQRLTSRSPRSRSRSRTFRSRSRSFKLRFRSRSASRRSLSFPGIPRKSRTLSSLGGRRASNCRGSDCPERNWLDPCPDRPPSMLRLDRLSESALRIVCEGDERFMSELRTLRLPSEDRIASELRTLRLPSEERIASELRTLRLLSEERIASELRTLRLLSDDRAEEDRLLPLGEREELPLDEREEPPDRSLALERSLPPPPPPPPLPPLPSRSASTEPVDTSSANIVATADVRIKVVVRMVP